MAPNMSGIAVTDQARSMALAELARDFALAHLKPGGAFLVKVFQGDGLRGVPPVAARRRSPRCVVRKPDASRGESAELYLLARGPQARLTCQRRGARALRRLETGPAARTLL